MSCRAKMNGEVPKRGETSIEFYKDGKPHRYCKGYVDNGTEELIETCKNCKENIIYAQEDLK